MSSSHLQNYHSPENHNRRVKVLIKKFNIDLDRAKGEYSEIIAREDEGEKLCFADEAQCSNLYLRIADLSRTLEQLNSLILPEENNYDKDR